MSMEQSNRKRRGFIKGKLPFYRAAKPTAPSVQYSSSKVLKPNQASPTTASVGFLVQQDYFAQPKQKVSFVVPAADSNRDKLSQLERFYGVIAADESVDSKAATYISSVQERFKLERLNSTKYQDGTTEQ